MNHALDTKRADCFGYWSLEILWDLMPGVWDF